MKILISPYLSESVFIDIKPEDKIEKIRKIIMEQFPDINIDNNMSFLFKNIFLNDNKTLKDYKIIENSTIFIVPKIEGNSSNRIKTLTNFSSKILSNRILKNKKLNLNLIIDKNFDEIYNNSKKLVGTIQILININSYSTLNLRVQKSDSILSIKNKIEKYEKIPSELQKLYYNNLELENHKNLLFYNIKNQSTLDLYNMENTIRQNINNINYNDGIPYQNNSLKVYNFNNNPQINSSKKNHYRSQSDTRKINLNLSQNNKQIEDNYFNSINLKQEKRKSTSALKNLNYQILIQKKNKITNTISLLNLNVSSIETIKSVKYKIFRKENIPISEQTLIFDNIELDNFKKLFDYKIKNGSVLYLDYQRNIYIFVYTPNSKSILIETSPFEIIEAFKGKITNITNIPIYQQKLFFNNIELLNHKTLFDYDILNFYDNSQSIFFMLKQMIYIEIRTFQGNILMNLEMEKFDTIFYIKNLIQQKENINIYNQQLIYNNIILEDNKTLEDYKMEYDNKPIIFLNIIFHIFVKNTYNNKLIVIECDSNFFVSQIKYEIKMIEGFYNLNQRLYFNNYEMNDNKRLIDYGITNDLNVPLILK